jgi:hypothetical protein
VNAQDRVQLFAGYSYARYSVFQLYSGPWTAFNFNGGLGSVAFRIAPHLSAEGEIGGAYNAGQSYNSLTFMGGPRISGGSQKITVFGHALFGAQRFTSNYSNGASDFAAVLGGGTDLWLRPGLGVRLAQVDLLLNRNSAAAQQGASGAGVRANLRIATGITFRF